LGQSIALALVLEKIGRKLIAAIAEIETNFECMERLQFNGCREVDPSRFPLLHSLSL
jgi:hypothetical protein